MNNHPDTYLNIFTSIDFDRLMDHPNILIAANFWEEDRYHAARVCYRFMRMIDDMIDNYKADHTTIAEDEKARFSHEVRSWIKTFNEHSDNNPQNAELKRTLSKYQIPLWTLEAFANAMIYDIHHDGFPTIEKFLSYTQGASVAPASIFVHLCGLQGHNGNYSAPAFDVRNAATPCAVFSYLVHIIRDFQKDQKNNLNYFADDLLIKNGLTRTDLQKISSNGNVSSNFRSLIREYYLMADLYRQKTYEVIERISAFLEPRYLLSLHIIFNLYLMVFERIDFMKGTFTTEELNPTSREIRDRVLKTIRDFNHPENK